MELEIKFIRTDGGTQARAKLNPETVDDYRDVLRDSDATWPFPAVVVFHDGSAYWLADGFHRIAAARQHGRFVCEADVRQGTQRDAVLYAAGANADHGLRRTNEDKRRAVLRLLEDSEWGQWSDREIARRCKVSHPFVGFIRAELEPVTGNITSERAYTTKHGTVATMKTGNIGGNGVSDKEPLPYPERCPRPSCQDDFRKYPPKKLGDGRWQCTNCDREFDENGRVPQSVNETESEGDALTAVERQTQLNERAYYWLADYTDQWGRTWRELEPNQVHHANSPCYQAFVRQFLSDRDHKFALKSALARLAREDAEGSNIAAFDDPVDALRALAPTILTFNGADYQREVITNEHGDTETRWNPVSPAPSLIDGPLNQMRQALSLMKYPGDHARVFRQWQQAPDTKREDGMMFGAIARLLEILVDELEADREVPMT